MPHRKLSRDLNDIDWGVFEMLLAAIFTVQVIQTLHILLH